MGILMMVVGALLLVLTTPEQAFANGMGPMSVQVLRTGLVVIVSIGGIVLTCVGNISDTNIYEKIVRDLKRLRGGR